MFEVGDIIVGLPQASEEYLLTRAGVKCKVERVHSDGIHVYVSIINDKLNDDEPAPQWLVESRFFELEKAHVFYNEKENKMSYKRINKDYKEII